MVFQSSALIGLMVHYQYLGINFHILGMILLWIALALTLGSGIDYFWKFYREMMNKE
jgi:CDP-diacylglycerol--glycerol-3-phosphate 3-phosphatidyltransferase